MSPEPPAPPPNAARPSSTAAGPSEERARSRARSSVVRAGQRGILLGAATAVLLWSLDAAVVSAAAEQVFDDRGEQLRFLRYSLGQMLGAGVTVGLIVGLVVGALDRAAASIAASLAAGSRQRSGSPTGQTEPALLARLTAALRVTLLAPAVLVAVTRIFDGRRARLLPAHHALVAAAALLSLVGLYALARKTGELLERPRSPKSTVVLILLASAVAGLLYALDLRVLPRLYPPFHLALEAGAACAALFIASLLSRRSRRLRPEGLPSWSAPSLLLLGLVCAAWSTRQMSWWPSLRATAFEHSVFEARLLDAAATFRRTLSPKASPAAGPAATSPRSFFTNGPNGSEDQAGPDGQRRAIGPGTSSGSNGPSGPGSSANGARGDTPAFPSPTGSPTGTAPEPPLPLGPHLPDTDVFLITVDAMRADRLDARIAPRLHAVAEEGVVFDHAYSQVPHTSFSIATLLTGKYVYSLTALGDEADRHETLADVFKRERYKTAAFFPPSVFFIDHDRFTEVERTAYHFEYVKYEYMAAPGRTDQVIRFLEDEHPERVFLWVHYFDPHEPYELHPPPSAPGSEHDGAQGGLPDPGDAATRTADDPPRPALTASSTDRDRYDGEVRFVDDAVARLVDYIRTHRRNALVVFTADHGEEFGEHGGRYHGTTLYEEQLRVPLFLTHFGTGGPLPARHVGAPVALIDLAPTLLSLADLVPSARMRGQDLGPWLSATGAATARLPPVYAEIGAKKLIAERDDRLICDLSRDFCELYDLGADPAEQRNLTGRNPERAAALKAQLDGWLSDQSTFERTRTGAGDGARDRAKDGVGDGARDRAKDGTGGEANGGAEDGARSRAGTVGDAAESPSARAALERGRLGDRSAARAVAALLDAPDPSLRAQAARVLLGLPDEPAIGAALAAAHKKSPGEATLSVLALRGGDATLADALAQREADDDAATDADRRLRAEVAIALGSLRHAQAVPLLGKALRGGGIDEELEKRVIVALGASRSPAALAPLVEHLDSVRTRLDVVRALGELHAVEAVAPLVAAVEAEPYVTVRAEMARVLGDLGDARATAPLLRLLLREHEAVVTAEVVVALAKLGATAHGVDLRRVPRWSCDAMGCVPPGKDTPLPLRPRAGETTWLVFAASADGVLEAAGERIELSAERRAYAVPGHAPIVLRALSGSPRLRAAFAAPATPAR